MSAILPQENSLNNSAVNKDRERRLLRTGDGSFTFWIPGVDETYHSRHGARQESMHVFIENGLWAVEGEEVSVLEVGMGTGLNVYLTERCRRGKVRYTALEPYPLEEEVVKELVEAMDEGSEFMRALHGAEFGKEVELAEGFYMTKKKVGLELLLEGNYDVIYYDAFGPRVEPDLWTLVRMQQCNNLLNPGGLFVTYCAKGEVRRNLQSAGFVVERLAGPPGKREMLRARKR